jgi:two-component sensor histidine kinase
MMLREIHHRVKNNLQIVISLVNLQSKSVALPAAQSAFTEIQTRMRALALVHRYLYESDDLQSVNISAFLTELCGSLQTAYGVPQSRVAMHIKSDPVFEIIDRAVPLALFMTETISNALRHAFPENRPGFIKVTLKALDSSQAVFTIEDNGIGLGTDPQENKEDGIYRVPKSMAGLGMSLARAFAKQIDGELSISGVGGTLVTLVFKSKPAPVAGTIQTS